MSKKRRVFMAVEYKMNAKERDALMQAIERAGSLRELAEILGLSKQAVHQWKRVPADHIVEIENATGVPRWELRPDLYEGLDIRA